MNYLGSDAIMLSRDVDVVAIPAGDTIKLPKGTEVANTDASRLGASMPAADKCCSRLEAGRPHQCRPLGAVRPYGAS